MDDINTIEVFSLMASNNLLFQFNLLGPVNLEFWIYMILFVEDVGRHNAVDSIAGMMWLERLKGEKLVFYTTGRLTSEMVIKGAQMGIPFLLSRSGVTQMGVEMARKVDLALFGRCSGKHFLLFSGFKRFVPELIN